METEAWSNLLVDSVEGTRVVADAMTQPVEANEVATAPVMETAQTAEPMAQTTATAEPMAQARTAETRQVATQPMM